MFDAFGFARPALQYPLICSSAKTKLSSDYRAKHALA
jgi:hypothetical protein